MGLLYHDLSRQVREYMASELEIASPDQSPDRHRGDLSICVDDLRTAVKQYDDDWLAQRLLEQAVTVDRERRKKGDELYWSYVNIAYAAQQAAQSEFNKLYMRGVCRLAIGSGIKQVEVYRAKAIAATFSESDELLGHVVDPESLLDVLRGSKVPEQSTTLRETDFVDTGLSVRLP